MSVVPLIAAEDPEAFGGKAVQLGAALRAGLPVPEGFALSWQTVEAVALGQPLDEIEWPLPCAVRSSAIGEDSTDASFAGTHLTTLGVCRRDDLRGAVRDVHASGQDPGAQAYRSKLGLDSHARMAVVIQALIDSDAAGVMFTRNPLTGAEERVIEASWGLGEAVVAGLVTPDRYVLDAAGNLTDHVVGEKDLAIRRTTDGGTVEEEVEPERVEVPCLGAAELTALHQLALACDEVFGTTEHDIEFAFRDETIYLLQRRPITRG